MFLISCHSLFIHHAPIFLVHQAFRVWALPGFSNSLYVLLFLIMSDLNVICFKNSSLAYFTMTHLLFNSYHNLKLFLYVYILVYFLSFPLILEYEILEKLILERILFKALILCGISSP